MDGCGHCDDFNKSGVWEKLNKMEWKNVSLHKYNCDEHMDRVKMFNIRGFPSIIIVDNSATPKMVASFEEERTEQKLLQFINKYEQMRM
jgi:thioredoxin-like negative regulator of GroEL